jgi:hypothetical protein
MDEKNRFIVEIYIDELLSDTRTRGWQGAIAWYVPVGLELKIVPTREWETYHELLENYLRGLDNETELIVYLEVTNDQKDHRLLSPIVCDVDVIKVIKIIKDMAREVAFAISWE